LRSKVSMWLGPPARRTKIAALPLAPSWSAPDWASARYWGRPRPKPARAPTRRKSRRRIPSQVIWFIGLGLESGSGLLVVHEKLLGVQHRPQEVAHTVDGLAGEPDVSTRGLQLRRCGWTADGSQEGLVDQRIERVRGPGVGTQLRDPGRRAVFSILDARQ